MFRRSLFLIVLLSVFNAPSFAQDKESLKAILLSKVEDAMFNKKYNDALFYLDDLQKNYSIKTAQVLYLKINVLTNLYQQNWPYIDSAINACDTLFAVTNPKKKTKEPPFPQEKLMEVTNISVDLKQQNTKYKDAYESLKNTQDIAAVQKFIAQYPKSKLATDLDSTYHDKIADKIKRERDAAIQDSSRKAEEQGAINDCKLADEYYRKLDYERALELYKHASEHDILRAHLQLATLYVNGWGTGRNEMQALEYIKKTDGKKLDSSQIGQIIKVAKQFKSEIKVDMQIECIKITAFAGDIKSEAILGYLYGPASNFKYDTLSLRWYNKAFMDGDSSVLYEIGYMNEAGLGCPKNTRIAITNYELAAKRNDCNAKCKLAQLYFASDYARSFDLYSQDCDCLNAKYYLALMLHDGLGREADKEAALKIFKAEDIDHPGGRCTQFLITHGYKQPPPPPKEEKKKKGQEEEDRN